MDFLGKGSVLIWITLLGVCPIVYNIIRLLGWVYHFSWLICYPCSLHLSLQNLPPPEDFGCEKIDGELVPIMTNCLPAPMALIELSVCSCILNCKTNRCKCRKNNLTCTDMCKCTKYDNSHTLENDYSDIEIDGEENNWLLKLIQTY